MKKLLKLSVLIAALGTCSAVYECCSPGSVPDSGQEEIEPRNTLKIGVMSFEIQSAGVWCDKQSEGYSFVFTTEKTVLDVALGKPPVKHALCLDIPFCDMEKQFNHLTSVPDGVDWHFTFETCYDGQLSGFYSQTDIKDGCMKAVFSNGKLNLEFYAATYDGNFVRCTYSGKPETATAYIWDFGQTKTNTRLIGGRRFVDLGDGKIWAAWNIGASSENDYGVLFENSGKDVFEIGGEDLAGKLWGDGWHVPSQEEWVAMVSSCRWKWVDNPGVTGLRGTSIYTGESIFLPAAGFADPQGRTCYRNTYGNYWSTTGYSKDEYVSVYFHEETPVPLFTDSDRMDRLSVRPVMSGPTMARSH